MLLLLNAFDAVQEEFQEGEHLLAFHDDIYTTSPGSVARVRLDACDVTLAKPTLAILI